MEEINQTPFKVEFTNPEIGNTYPVYGVITKILNEDAEGIEIQLNSSISCRLTISSDEERKGIKDKILESGIFIGTVSSITPEVKIDCKMVIFGKSPNFVN